MEPFVPLPSDARTAWTQHRVSVPVCHLLFCSVLECDILNTRILEYVFLKCSINFGFIQNKVLTSVSVSLVLCGPLRQQFQGERRREWCGSHRRFEDYTSVVCTVAVFRECLPFSHCPIFCLLLPLDWQMSVFCIF